MSGRNERIKLNKPTDMKQFLCAKCGIDTLSLRIGIIGLELDTWIDVKPRFHKSTQTYCYRGGTDLTTSYLFSIRCMCCGLWLSTDKNLEQVRSMLLRYPVITGPDFDFENIDEGLIQLLKLEEKDDVVIEQVNPTMGRIAEEYLREIDVAREDYLREESRKLHCSICRRHVPREEWHVGHKVCLDCYNS